MKKENATLAQQIEVINWYHNNGRSQSATAHHFAPLYPNLQIKQPLVSSWIKEEEKWQKLWQETNCQGDWSTKRAQQTEHPKIDEMMHLWVSKVMGDGILVTGEVLHQNGVC